MLNENKSSFEKIAQEDATLADCIVKVAEDEVSAMSDEELINDFVEEARENEVDTESQEFNYYLGKAAESGEVFDSRVGSAVDIIAEDIEQALSKAAEGGDPGYQTNAAAKVVENWMDLTGGATLGSGFGPGGNAIGSSIAPTADANVFGGNGRQLYTGQQYSRAVSAINKPGNALASSNMNNIRLASDEASDEEVLNNFFDICKEAADAEGQSVEEYLYDIGMETINDEVKPEVNSEAYIDQKKEASDAIYEWIVKTAEDNEVHPDDLVLQVGIEKAAEALDELADYMEKEAVTSAERKVDAAGRLLNRAAELKKKTKGKGKRPDTSVKSYLKGFSKRFENVTDGLRYDAKKYFGTQATTNKAGKIMRDKAGKVITNNSIMNKVKNVPAFVKKHPYATGAAAIGTAGAVAGGRALYKKLRKNDEPKEASEPGSYMKNLVADAKKKLYS